jgi:hypothetical protein
MPQPGAINGPGLEVAARLVVRTLTFSERHLGLLFGWSGSIGLGTGGAQGSRRDEGEYHAVSLGARHVSPFQSGGFCLGEEGKRQSEGAALRFLGPICDK